MLHDRRRGDRRRRLLWVFSFLLTFYFSVFVWPTAWRYHQVGNTPMRTNRVTGQVEFLNLQGWQPVLDAFDTGSPRPRPTRTPPAPDVQAVDKALIPAQ
ncbi:MAG: hypothetical protein ABR576_03460 [Thermoanaerobaculia bacterium]